ncbi:unnamed protein product [Polarella glacialis]|uniref:Uncharacterized protein n=1 Tax=Polarella glacialis TaxID=89957 RepID=A0A813FPM3_POLGL|nr:unnamed protein product [Polarella glacialis]
MLEIFLERMAVPDYSDNSGEDAEGERSPERNILAELAANGDVDGTIIHVQHLQQKLGFQAAAWETTSCDFGQRNAKSPLHTAAMRGRASIMRVFLEVRADPNAVDDPGNTGLHYAADMGHARVALLLLESGACPTTMNNFGTTPAAKAEARDWDSEAVAQGKEWIRKMLQGHFGQIDEMTEEPPPKVFKSLHDVSSAHLTRLPAGFFATMDRKMSRVDSEYSSEYSQASTAVTWRDLDSETSHHESLVALVRIGHLDAIRDMLGEVEARGGLSAVLEEVENQEETDQDHRIVTSPLHAAAAAGRPEVLRELLAARADANLRNGAGNTPLHAAADLGRVEALQILLEAGAERLVRNSFGRSPEELTDPKARPCEELQCRKVTSRRILQGLGLDIADASALGPRVLHI